MKKIILILVVMFVFTACVSKSIVKFEEVGYAKYSSNVRIKTFNVAFVGNLSRQEKLDLIYQHGKGQQQTPGRMTTSYYYLNGLAPYIDQGMSVDYIIDCKIDCKFDYMVAKFPNLNVEPSFLNSNFQNPYIAK